MMDSFDWEDNVPNTTNSTPQHVVRIGAAAAAAAAAAASASSDTHIEYGQLDIEETSKSTLERYRIIF
jgi:hypothetical protein